MGTRDTIDLIMNALSLSTYLFFCRNTAVVSEHEYPISVALGIEKRDAARSSPFLRYPLSRPLALLQVLPRNELQQYSENPFNSVLGKPCYDIRQTLLDFFLLFPHPQIKKQRKLMSNLWM